MVSTQHTLSFQRFEPLYMSCVCQAREVLTSLLETVNPDEILHSPNTTSTFSTLPSPRKQGHRGEELSRQEDEEPSREVESSRQEAGPRSPDLIEQGQGEGAVSRGKYTEILY